MLHLFCCADGVCKKMFLSVYFSTSRLSTKRGLPHAAAAARTADNCDSGRRQQQQMWGNTADTALFEADLVKCASKTSLKT
jgi:hypothetical protein